ncbi:hypothetical protein K491DRAFT_778158 [Lophiostoma macrostomum CBS 122681]|uniref:Uncharacterized protein n=1 Tax=Lophiostoma macrostomum CBS 122681 TaxID=1314788 RepID=A0A6A6T8A3_9PLEO|nr:hypothetical protein K491DRAFT_778158 [Lophiostoma macrostomum CBS 122681]
MSAATPHATSMSAHKGLSNSPRRVLGDLAPRSLNTPSKQNQALEALRAQSPLKQVQTLSPHVLVDKENMAHAVAPKAGRKRSINEVDGAENVDRGSSMFTRRDDGGLWRTGAPLQAATLQKLAEQGAAELKSDDEDDGGSTVPNTPTPEPEELEPEVVDNSQASNQSFSNFLNYDACDSQPTEPPPPAVDPPKSTRAELLRLRLGLATYKVKTNQVDKSGSDIISHWETTYSSSTTDLNASTSSAATLTSSSTSAANKQTIPSITLSPVRREPVLHVTARLDPGQPIPKLVGGPQLLPTAFSSRMIHDYNLPSSPPDQLPKCVSPEEVYSPTHREYTTPVARRLRDGNEEGGEEVEELTVSSRMQKQREKRFERGDVTSSVVKGNAAKGLLELMSGRR